MSWSYDYQMGFPHSLPAQSRRLCLRHHAASCLLQWNDRQSRFVVFVAGRAALSRACSLRMPSSSCYTCSVPSSCYRPCLWARYVALPCTHCRVVVVALGMKIHPPWRHHPHPTPCSFHFTLLFPSSSFNHSTCLFPCTLHPFHKCVRDNHGRVEMYICKKINESHPQVL
ncbi:hypothetical protein BV22DRAFT_368308 [Leucogyrophana mollusca]|uniref:Uncharacterized protein n=1 Tax=Leucogyrophana mollusca TaxID=85980 RepID=A0ACB8BN00_9AGAM|nr:hypothetical protein BV22DRAFT_368308 [Leucogyrophana mollusca]